MKNVKLYEEFLNDDQKVQEDFAAVGTPPGGNVIGMGSVTAPTPGHLGSGDSWPSLGAPAVPVQVNSSICPICKKSKKECTCEDSPSEKRRKKLKKIKVEEMLMTPRDMKYVDLFEGRLADVKLSNEEAEEIFSVIKDSVKSGEAWGMKYAAEFGKNPEDKRFKIGQISATTFDLLVMITEDRKVVCYATLGYDTLKHKLKDKPYVNFIDTEGKYFAQKSRQYKKIVYQG